MKFAGAHLAYALRIIRKDPGFYLAVVVTLALGIAANTAVFTLTDALVLRPLPYAHPEQLVLLEVTLKAEGSSSPATLNRYEMLRDHSHALSSVAVATNDSLNLTGAGLPQQVPVARVSGNFFETLGMQPQIGRLFTGADARPESAGVAVLSESCWRTVFNSDAGIVGRTINLDSAPYTIVGVLPAGARFPFLGAADIWIPRYFEYSLFTTERLRMGVGYLSVIGRIAPGRSIESAGAEMQLLDRQYSEANPKAPDAGAQIETRVSSLASSASASVRPRLLMLSAAVAFVLLIACANAANLLLWRVLSRGREVAIRTVLGASRGTIVVQFLVESVLVGLLAGATGLGLSVAATRAVARFGPEAIAGAGVHLDWRVALFTLAVSLATGLGFGLAPAIQISRPSVQSSLRVEGMWSTSSRGHAFVRGSLLIAQVTLSLLLLVGAGLLIRSFARLLHTDVGFDPANVLTMNVSLPTAKYAKPEQQVEFFRNLLPRIQSLPGVRSAAISSALPPVKKRVTPMLPEGQAEVPLAQRPFITLEMVSPRWFETMRVPLRSGRDFSDGDVATSAKVLIVNQAFAQRFWPNENAIGKHVAIGRMAASEVVGVVGDVKNNGIAADPQPQVYVPFAQLPWSSMNLLVRTEVEPHSLVAPVRDQVLGIDRDQPVSSIRTADELLGNSRAELRFTTMLLGVFAVLALALALIGLYGVLAYSVAQRRRELAIRMALGASSESVAQLIVRQGLTLVAIGLAAGIVASLLLSRLIASVLYKVSVIDPVAFLLAPAVFVVTAVIASYLPARRAGKISVWEALK